MPSTYISVPPKILGQVLTCCATSPSNPTPEIVRKHRPFTSPTSMRRRSAVTSARAAASGSRGRRSALAKSLPVPTGTTPRAAWLPVFSIPLATSWTVPSPPTAMTTSAGADAASSMAWPRRSVTLSSTVHPASSKIGRTRGPMRAPRPQPAAGLIIACARTWTHYGTRETTPAAPAGYAERKGGVSGVLASTQSRPLVVEVLAPSVTGTGVTRLLGLEPRAAARPGDPGGHEAYQLWVFLDELRETFGGRIAVHLIEPLSVAWMIRVLRYRPKRYPAFVVGRRRVVSGLDQGAVTSTISALLLATSTPGP